MTYSNTIKTLHILYSQGINILNRILHGSTSDMSNIHFHLLIRMLKESPLKVIHPNRYCENPWSKHIFIISHLSIIQASLTPSYFIAWSHWEKPYRLFSMDFLRNIPNTFASSRSKTQLASLCSDGL